MHGSEVWYLVINSNRARILRGLPPPHQAAEPEVIFQSEQRKLRDVLEDRPTRSFSSGDHGRRSGVEPGSDPLREDELRFLHEVLGYLSARLRARDFSSLVVVAPPDVLGLIRAEMPENLQRALRLDLPRNLVRLSSAELVAAIRAHLVDEGILLHAGQPMGWRTAGQG